MRVSTVLVPLLAFIVWRNHRIARNAVLSRVSLPPAYYANGAHDNKCQVLYASPDMKYCEDAVFWDIHDQNSAALRKRVVLLSCDPGRKSWNTVMGPLRDPEPHGALWIYDTSSTYPPRRVSLHGYPSGHDFHPLGLEVAPSVDGIHPVNLFVVNHARKKTFIEQFKISPTEPTKATWIRTITSPYFVSPNSIALTSDSSFYVTNDHLMTRRLPNPLGKVLPVLESVLAIPGGFVLHVSINDDSTTDVSVAALGIPFANGIKISPQGDTVAIAATSLGLVHYYTRDLSTNALSFDHFVEVPFCVDNLSYNGHGQVIAAGHPSFPALVGVAANKTDAKAGTWIVSIGDKDRNDMLDKATPVSIFSKVPESPYHTLQTLFQSDGSIFGSSSTGLLDERTGILYGTGLYESGLLICKP